MSAESLAGLKINRLTVLSSKPHKSGRTHWLCLCDCGNYKVIRSDQIKSGAAKSCGCYHKDAVTKHKACGTPEYKVYSSMLQRCLNSNHRSFKDYGARGISVCKRWADSFSDFYLDMGERPKGMTLDRIDNNGNYEPSNCRWATMTVQSNNRRSNRLLTCKGKTQSMADWGREMGISRKNIQNRLTYGWSVFRAINEPLNVIGSK